MTYTVVYEQDETGAWNVTVEGQRGVYTFGRTLAAARRHAREALALWLEVESESLDIRDEVRLPEAAQRAIAAAEQARTKLEQDQSALRDAMTDAARALVASGLSLRDAGGILGVSYQRVHQLAHA